MQKPPRTRLAALLLTLAATASAACGEPSTNATATPANSASATQPAAGRRSGDTQRLREGTQLTDVVGQFDFTGDRVAFFPAGGKDSYRVLENLALERVSRLLGEGSDRPAWVVSGTVTEFRGANYLLLQKVLAQPQRPAPLP